MKITAATSLLFILICVLPYHANAAETKPNFVFILTDDQRWDMMGVVQAEQGEKGRFPFLKTPNLDKLASQGVRFRNAFVVNSLCSPSRASFLTGMYGHHNGIQNNFTHFPADNVTFATLLKSAGYTTGFVGKWHMGGQKGHRPGFDYSASYPGHGRHFDCPFEVNGKQVATKGWVDDVAKDFVIDFLRLNKNKPFLVAFGLKACHGPFTPPPRHAHTYENEKARAVPNLTAKAPYDHIIRSGEMADRGFLWRKQNELLACMQFTAGIDEIVGQIMNELDRLELTDNTVVIFASDNGYYLGEHSLGDKRTAYDESLRIPLLIRYPKIITKGKTVDEMVLNIDLAPTLLNLAGIPIPKQMQGLSWRPLLKGEPTAWRKSFYYEYTPEKRYPVPGVQAIRTETAKLIQYPGHPDWTEIFDLTADPYEINNLINNPDKAELRRTLETELQQQRDKALQVNPARPLI